MGIGQVLKEHRIKCELTQEQLSEEIFVSRKTISNWETGKTTPDIESLIRLANLFNLSLDNLLLEGSDVVEDMKKKERAYNIQKSFTFGAQLTNILLLIFLFSPGISSIFYMSDAMYFILLVIICSNTYTILLLQKEVKKFTGTDLEAKSMKHVVTFYFVLSFIIYGFVLINKYIIK